MVWDFSEVRIKHATNGKFFEVPPQRKKCFDLSTPKNTTTNNLPRYIWWIYFESGTFPTKQNIP